MRIDNTPWVLIIATYCINFGSYLPQHNQLLYATIKLHMENVEVSSSSPLVGLTIEAARHHIGAAVPAISKKSGKLLINPPVEETIQDGDRLIVISAKKQLATLENTFEGGRVNAHK